jgi:pimeloyl-ACP methyl ester carboxylesterase
MRLPVPAGRLIDVGGHRLHLVCEGRGASLLLDAALGASSLSWTLVLPELARFAHACAYDRAGFGWSEAGPLPRTAGRIVDELRLLLSGAGIPLPIVLVGHSFGALTARLFQQRFPAGVAGLVLLDPPEDTRWRRPSAADLALIARGTTLCRYGERAARLGAADLVVRLVELGAHRLARRVGRLAGRGALEPADEFVLAPAQKLPDEARDAAKRFWTQPRFFQALGSQISSITTSAAELDEAMDLGDLPLVVVSSQRSTATEQRAHRALAARSSRGQHLVAERSGHWIPLDRPDVVVRAIQLCLAKVSGNWQNSRGSLEC